MAIFSFTTVQGQETRFGATAGLVSATIKVEAVGQSASLSESGFYLGLIADITVSDVFHVQPELTYANIDDTGFLQLPIMAKYFVSEEFTIQAGPQITYTLEDVINDFIKFNID